MAPPPSLNPPLAAVTSVFSRVHCEVATLEHIAESIEAFADGTRGRISLVNAAKTGSLRLFHRVLHHEQTTASEDDPILLRHRLGRALEAALRHGHAKVAQGIGSCDPRPLFHLRHLHAAVACGDLELIQWTIAQLEAPPTPADIDVDDPDQVRVSVSFDLHDEWARLACFAADRGHFHLLRWLWDHRQLQPLTARELRQLGDSAARHGDIETMQWIASRRSKKVFSWQALTDAARCGRLDVVKYLVESLPDDCTAWGPGALEVAILEGQDAVATFLREHLAWRPSPTLVVDAGRLGRLDLIEAYEQGRLDLEPWRSRSSSRCDILQAAFAQALEHGHLCVAERIAARMEVLVPAETLAIVAAMGHRHVLEWLHSRTMGEWNVDVLDAAAANGQRDVLRWLHDHRHEGCSTRAMDGAASNGHLEVVAFLHAHRHEGGTVDAMNGAAAGGHLEVLQWLHQHRTEGCTSAAMDLAAENGHLDVVVWLHQHRTEGCTAAAMDVTADDDVLQWLARNRREGCGDAATSYAAFRGSLRTLEFLRTHQIGHFSADTAMAAAQRGRVAVLTWLCRWYPECVDLEAVRAQARVYGQRHLLRWLPPSMPAA